MAEYEKATSPLCHIVRLSREELGEALRLWLKTKHRPKIKLPKGTGIWTVKTIKERQQVDVIDPFIFTIKEEVKKP